MLGRFKNGVSRRVRRLLRSDDQDSAPRKQGHAGDRQNKNQAGQEPAIAYGSSNGANGFAIPHRPKASAPDAIGRENPDHLGVRPLTAEKIPRTTTFENALQPLSIPGTEPSQVGAPMSGTNRNLTSHQTEESATNTPFLKNTLQPGLYQNEASPTSSTDDSDITHTEPLHADEATSKILDSGRVTTTSDANFNAVKKHTEVDFDHTIHKREPVVHEEIKPHVHHVYHVERTRSIHYHEHKTFIQPIADPDPTVLPEQHWAQDRNTGEIFKIPDELGRQMM